MNTKLNPEPITPTLTQNDAATVRSLLLSVAADLGQEDEYGMELTRIAGLLDNAPSVAL